MFLPEKPSKDAVNIQIRFTLLPYCINSSIQRASQRAYGFAFEAWSVTAQSSIVARRGQTTKLCTCLVGLTRSSSTWASPMCGHFSAIQNFSFFGYISNGCSQCGLSETWSETQFSKMYGVSFAFRTFNFRRFLGLQLSSLTRRNQGVVSLKLMRRQQERNQAATILTYRELPWTSHLPSPCASLGFYDQRQRLQSLGALLRLWRHVLVNHDSKSRTHVANGSGPVESAPCWWKRCLWTGRGGRIWSGSGQEGREESEQAGIHEPSTTVTHRASHDAHFRPDLTKCAHSIWTKVSGCGPKVGRNTRMKHS